MKNLTNLFFQEVLDKNRLKLLPKLNFFKNFGFYLAGGTALALQYGHRKSIDFDFFIKENINTEKLYNNILKEFKGEKVIKTFEEKNTLYIEINDIKISFMTYNYDLIDDLIETDFLNLASDKDIAPMKLWAIQNRATNKDYVDLFYILQSQTLENILKNFDKKFGKIINKNLILKSLVYFDDIIEEKLIMNNKLEFSQVKKFLEKIVN